MDKTLFIISREEAKRIGLTRFFDALPCIRGHVCYRTTINARCKYCAYGDPSDPEDRVKKKALANERAKEYYHKNKEKGREQAVARYHRKISQDPESIRKYTRKYWAENKDKLSERNLEWRKNNIGRLRTYSIKRKRSTKLRIPKWADMRAINEVYKERKRIELETGIPHEVDHIVPLHGKLVCGLHVHYNLRVITKDENQAKRNNFVDDLIYNEPLSN